MKRILAVAVLVLVPLISIGQDSYIYQNLARCPQGTTALRAQHMGAHEYFEGYYTFENPGDVAARAVVYFLNTSTGAPASSLVVIVEAGADMSGYLLGDSCSYTNYDPDDSIQVSVRGSKPVDRFGK